MIASYAELAATIGRLWKLSRHTVYFLAASALFRDGLAGVFAFGAVIAAGTFGFSSGDVVVFGAAANIVAGLSTIAFGLLDDKIGPKKVIIMALVALILMGTVVFVLHDGERSSSGWRVCSCACSSALLSRLPVASWPG